MEGIKKYIELRDKFCEKLEEIQHNLELSAWDFYTNSKEENLDKYTQVQEQMSDLYKDEDLYKKLKQIQEIGLEDKHLARQLKNLVKDFYNEIESGEELKELRDKENEIAQKYNSYIMELDGEKITPAEISVILETETNVDVRKKAYETLVKRGDEIAQDIVQLVQMRNDYAKIKGYDNYFNYMIEDTYEISPQKLEQLIKEVYSKIKDESTNIEQIRKAELAKAFSIAEEDLRDWHFGLQTENNPTKAVSQYLSSKEQVVEICKMAYKNMGYDIENMGITLDLFPRENKNTHGFAFCIKPGEDARILANLTNNIRSIDTLLHELGHCVYDIGIDKDLPLLDRDCASSVMTEAIAMMMGDLVKTENILKDIVPNDILQDFKKELKKDEARFVSRSLQIIEFEKEMYKNPTQDLKKLWQEMKIKHLYRNDKTELNNEWATIPHYLSHPGYYQNYFRAGLIKAQIYNTLINNLGLITENSKTAQFLDNNIFKIGATLEEEELVEKLTGKPVSTTDFCERIISAEN